MSGAVHVHGFAVGPFQSNTWIVSQAGHAYVLDPGDEPGRALAYVAEKKLQVESILLTHGHIDHVGAVAALEREWNVDTYMHPRDQFLIDALPDTCAMYGLPPLEPPARLKDLRGEDTFSLGPLVLRAVETPGHTPGHVIFRGPGFVIAGDLIFAGSVGRTDLPGGSTPQLLQSIEDSVLTLPDETVLYSGHGGATTVGEERIHNPFLQPGAI